MLADTSHFPIAGIHVMTWAREFATDYWRYIGMNVLEDKCRALTMLVPQSNPPPTFPLGAHHGTIGEHRVRGYGCRC